MKAMYKNYNLKAILFSLFDHDLDFERISNHEYCPFGVTYNGGPENPKRETLG